MDDYKIYRKEKTEQGVAYQDFVAWQFCKFIGWPLVNYDSKTFQYNHGENVSQIEIKLCSKFTEYQHLYIETEEKSHPNIKNYSPSGIYRGDNWLFVTGDQNTIFIFATQRLRELYEEENFRFKTSQSPTSRGFILPTAAAERYSSLILYPRPKDIEIYFGIKNNRKTA